MPNRLFRCLIIFAAFAATTVTGTGQAFAPRGESTAPGAGRAMPVAPAIPVAPGERSLLVDQNKKLSVGDVVSIAIEEDREPAVARQVTPTGDVDVASLIRVRVVGKTAREAEAEIKRRLEADYYHRATVRVSIEQVNAQATMGRIHVQGEVRAPTVVETYAGENLTVTEAILRAGGFKEFANPTNVQITRLGGGKMTVDIRKIQREGDAAKDVILKDGDRVFVQKKLFNF